MPWINKATKVKKEPAKQAEYTDHKLLRRTAYNNSKWRKLRETYMHQHPVCEECLKKGKITAATSVHHLKSPFNYKDGTTNNALLLDYDNLESVCHQCHQELHNKNNEKSPEELLKAFEDLLNDVE